MRVTCIIFFKNVSSHDNKYRSLQFYCLFRKSENLLKIIIVDKSSVVLIYANAQYSLAVNRIH